MSAWLGVVSAQHVARGVSLGIAQIGHGKRAGLARLRDGDTLIYYSSVDRLGDTVKLQQFTAVGVIDGEEIWQADEGDFRPFRRAVRYERVRPVHLDGLKDRPELTSSPNWGYRLRRGLIPLTVLDAHVIQDAMIVS